MEYSDELLKKMITLGTLGYNIEKIINILDIPKKHNSVFIADFNNPDSELRQAYQKGIDQSDYAVDQKLFKEAQNGNLKAIELYSQRKNTNMSTIDSQEFELKKTMIDNEKQKFKREKEADNMINQFLGYGDSE